MGPLSTDDLDQSEPTRSESSSTWTRRTMSETLSSDVSSRPTRSTPSPDPRLPRSSDSSRQFDFSESEARRLPPDLDWSLARRPRPPTESSWPPEPSSSEPRRTASEAEGSPRAAPSKQFTQFFHSANINC